MENTDVNSFKTVLPQHAVKVLLVDDQAMIGEAVRRMLAQEADISFHYCNKPSEALQMARELAPTVILQDLVMPEIDGLTLVKSYRAEPGLQNTPLIVLSTREEPTTKAEAFALGANDYLVKLPDRLELVARIRYHSRGYINFLERNEAFQALLASQKALAAELAEAAAYVQSLLPAPLEQGSVRADWRFIPSTSLGGDAFGYHWLDDDRFCMFLLDVCGHGVGAALLSISAMNVLRSRALPQTDFWEPGAMLTRLNEAFQMEDHNNMYFTIWYGVYTRSTRMLAYASAGHPPALLINSGSKGHTLVCELGKPSMVLGGMTGTVYQTETHLIAPDSSLFLLSDGVYEIARPDQSMWTFGEFAEFMADCAAAGKSEIAELLHKARAMHGVGPLEDDFSIVKLRFPEATG